eukprot:TRINITY_DN6235_c0_g1_i1.p1 TRINITY_DN6235_c0_g1~~TRINITY_DN6235_c0_g1_i1.p1  ORF type:complete len:573 (+),score=74.29 TRINITY_DN6235_c0_g1_i1:770-2488(+)
MKLAWFLLVGGVASTAANTFRINIGEPIPGVKPVPENFASFSVEVHGMMEFIGPNGTRRSYAQALKNLRKSEGSTDSYRGPIVRIGGNSADASCWESVASAKCSYNITQADFDAYKTFVKETAADVNTRLVLDVNMGLSADPNDYALGYVKAATASNLWEIVEATEIGNEENLYHDSKHGYRNKSYSFNDYYKEFGDYVKVLTQGGLPAGSIRGGTWCCDPHNGWDTGLETYLKEYGQTMNSMSLHQYAATYCNPAVDKNQTVFGQTHTYGVINDLYEGNFSFHRLFDESNALNVPIYMGEGNSANCGGVPGVSDAFESALWAMDFLPILSKDNVMGMNFHGGTSGAYTPLAYSSSGDLMVRPVYYGMLAFAELTANKAVWLTSDYATAPVGDIRCESGVNEKQICCAKECGSCTQTDCRSRPGGSDKCCPDTITSSGKKCLDNSAPCVMETLDDFPLNTHAVKDTVKNQVRVLITSKNVKVNTTQVADICGDFDAAATGTYFTISAPSYKSKFGEGLSYGGQTFDTSSDGIIQGTRKSFNAPKQSVGGATCFSVEVKAMESSLLTIQMPAL